MHRLFGLSTIVYGGGSGEVSRALKESVLGNNGRGRALNEFTI